MMNQTLVVSGWGVSFIASFCIGLIGGYAQGTSVSYVRAAPSLMSNQANRIAETLLLSSKDSAIDVKVWADEMLQSDLENFYFYLDSGAYENETLKRFSYFDINPDFDIEVVAHYLLENKSAEEIKKIEVFSRVVNDNQD